jgi:hypothetical protein
MTAHVSLYRQVMGRDFESLAPELQTFHSMRGNVRLLGQCTVSGPHTSIGKLLGALFALPKTSAETLLAFDLSADARQETWKRHFPNRLMTSRMRVVNGVLVERLGPADLHFELRSDGAKLIMLLKKISIAGIRCPQFLVPSVVAEETASPGKLHFNVAAQLPVVGLLVAYKGFLHITVHEAAI